METMEQTKSSQLDLARKIEKKAFWKSLLKLGRYIICHLQWAG